MEEKNPCDAFFKNFKEDDEKFINPYDDLKYSKNLRNGRGLNGHLILLNTICGNPSFGGKPKRTGKALKGNDKDAYESLVKEVSGLKIDNEDLIDKVVNKYFVPGTGFKPQRSRPLQKSSTFEEKKPIGGTPRKTSPPVGKKSVGKTSPTPGGTPGKTSPPVGKKSIGGTSGKTSPTPGEKKATREVSPPVGKKPIRESPVPQETPESLSPEKSRPISPTTRRPSKSSPLEKSRGISPTPRRPSKLSPSERKSPTFQKTPTLYSPPETRRASTSKSHRNPEEKVTTKRLQTPPPEEYSEEELSDPESTLPRLSRSNEQKQ